MLFNSFQFLIFFPIVVLFLFILPSKARVYWLLIVSYYFYMCWNAKYALLLAFSTLITWCSGMFIERAKNDRQKKLYVMTCCLVNFLILFLFKYMNFVIDNLNSLLGHISNAEPIPQISLLLPVGISFYIFQAVGYIIDVYRGDIKAERNLCRYALFISFFPQLVAGPIERAGNMMQQIGEIDKKNLFQYNRVKSGFLLMAWGMFQKIVISDRIAIIVDEVYSNYAEYGLTTIVFATVMFAFQIYCDFAGYTNIARGAAEVMGFRLMDNFRQPYLASSVNEFWKRWHISLTSWFRDYLYIPLGGNRRGIVRKMRNVLIVFLVSGLWHGAGWNFVVWGGIHGVAQIVSSQRKRNEKLSLSGHIRKSMLTFLMVDFAWLFFRADSIQHAIALIRQMTVQIGDLSMVTELLDKGNWLILWLGLAVLVIADILHESGISLMVLLQRQEIWFRYAVYLILICSCIYLGVSVGNSGVHQFIYFQF